MAMDVGPDGGIAIQVPSAEAVFQPCSPSRDQNQRSVVGRNPIPHLGERMPDMSLVELDEGFGGVFHGMEVERRSIRVMQYWSGGVFEWWKWCSVGVLECCR